VLVKSVALSESSVRATALARLGIVDPAFPDYFARSGSEGWCAADADHAAMSAALKSGRGPGTRIVAATARRLPVVSGMLTSRADRSRTRRQ
jgi:hypothetical protein